MRRAEPGTLSDWRVYDSGDVLSNVFRRVELPRFLGVSGAGTLTDSFPTDHRHERTPVE